MLKEVLFDYRWTLKKGVLCIGNVRSCGSCTIGGVLCSFPLSFPLSAPTRLENCYINY